ncbi:MAG: RNase H family protein [Candidatus Hodarchaeota archaeon]
MKVGEIIPFALRNLDKFSERINLNNFHSIRRFLTLYYFLLNSEETNAEDLEKFSKEIILSIKELDVDFLNIHNLESLFYILDMATQYSDQRVVELIKQKIESIRDNFQKTKIRSFYLYEHLLIEKSLRDHPVSNGISLRALYYVIRYRKISGVITENQKQILWKILIRNYFIDIQKEFAYFPSARTKISTIHPSNVDSFDKDYWVFKIYENIKGSLDQDYAEILETIKNRAQYCLESYGDELNVRIDTYRAVYILHYMNENSIKRFKKLLLDFNYIAVNLLISKEILYFLNLQWCDILFDYPHNGLNRFDNVELLVNFCRERKLIKKTFLDFFNAINQLRDENKSDLSIDVIEELTNLLENDPDFREICLKAYLSSRYNIITIPDLTFIKDIQESMIRYIMLKLLLDQNIAFQLILKNALSFEEKYIPLTFKRIHFFIPESKIEGFLSEFAFFKPLRRIKNKKHYSKKIYRILNQLKGRFSQIDIPFLNNDDFEGEYVVYPYTVANLNYKDNEITNLRMTVAFRDFIFKQKIQEIKSIFSNFFNDLCNFAERNYNIFEFYGRQEGNKEMIEFLRIFFEEGFDNVLKLDIEKCTDNLEYPPLEFLINETLPTELAEIMVSILKNFTIEFKNKRVITKRGIAQGNPLSSELYIYILLINLILSIVEAKVDLDNIKILTFGDDIVIASKRIEDIIDFFSRIEYNFHVTGWSLNKDKCSIITQKKMQSINSLNEIAQKREFDSVGLHLEFLDDIRIKLDENRINNVKMRFWWTILKILNNLYYNKSISYRNFLDVYQGYHDDSQIYPESQDFDGNSIEDYIFENLTSVTDLLFGESIDFPKDSVEDSINILTLKLKELSIFPDRIEFIPDLIIYTDGAADPNPGLAGAGIRIDLVGQEKQILLKEYLGLKTNNEAEYLALIIALRHAGNTFGWDKRIKIYSDSQIMVYHFKGDYYVRDKRLADLHKYQKNLEKKFLNNGGQIEIEHIYGRENVIADKLSKEAVIEGRMGKIKEYTF